MLKSLILFLLSTMTAFAAGIVSDASIMPSRGGYRNYVLNPTARLNSRNVTVSSATIARDTDAGDSLDGLASFVCDASAQNGYCQFTLDTIEQGDRTGNCEFKGKFKGDGTLYKAQITDGTNAVNSTAILGNVTDWSEFTLNYPCGATRTVRITQTEAGTAPALNVGRLYYGAATNIGDGYISTQWQSYTPTFTSFGTVTSPECQHRRDGVDQLVRCKFTSGTVVASEARVSLAGGVSSASTTQIPSIQAAGNYFLNQTATFHGGAILIEPSVGYVTFGDSATFGNSSISPLTKANGSAVVSSSNILSFSARVPISGWESSGSAVRPESGGESWSGFHGSDCTFTRTSATLGDPAADATCTFTERTNVNFGTVTSYLSGSDPLPGIVFTPKKAQSYFVCASPQSGSATNAVEAEIVMNDLSSTFIGRGFFRHASTTVYDTGTICGIYRATDVSSKTIRLQARQSSGQVFISNSSDSNAVEWSIFPVSTGQSAPALVGSVTSASTGSIRIESARLAAPSGGACVVSQETGDFINGNATSPGSGRCAVTFSSGMFTSAPNCSCTTAPGVTTVRPCVISSDPTTSGVEFYTSNSGGAVNENVYIMCMGQR